MEYAIIDYKTKNRVFDFNNAKLDTPSGQLYLQHLTEKGYYSQKALRINFEYSYFNDGGVDCLIISKETAIFLIENYTNLNGKIFQTYEQRKKTEKAAGDLAWCSSMKDPYDVG
jgi:hypothetical protein